MDNRVGGTQSISLKYQPPRYNHCPIQRQSVTNAYNIGEEAADPNDEDISSFRQSTQDLFEDTLKRAEHVITSCFNAADEALRTCTAPRIVIDEAARGGAKPSELSIQYHYAVSMRHPCGST